MSPKSSKTESPEAFLKRKGWVRLDTDHIWEWQKPPLPGQFTLKDALSTEQSVFRNTTTAKS